MNREPDDESNGVILERLEAIERRLAGMGRRLDALEYRVPIAPDPRRSVTPELTPSSQRVNGGVPPHVPSRTNAPAASVAAAAFPQQSAAGGADELEYKIGVAGLMRGGAVVVIVGIIYLVGLALSRGWVTPQTQFIGEILLCLGFLGFGAFKRHEREEFGQLMMGIGSCGLYLSFAGGHLFKDLYVGKVVVLLFLLLSFANLGYAWWRGSRSFWAIGMVGGFLAAMMPMQMERQGIALTLHFMILVPSAIVVLRHRWSSPSVLLWVLATAALVPALFYEGDWTRRVFCLYASSLLCAWVCAKTPKDSNFDPLEFVGPGLFLTGAFGFGIRHDEWGVGHITLLGAAIAGLAMTFGQDSRQRLALLTWAAIVVAVLAPFGLTPMRAAVTFSGLSIFISLLALRAVPSGRLPKGTIALAWLELALALGAFVISSSAALSPGTEAALLVLLMGAAALCVAANTAAEEAVIALGISELCLGFSGLLIGAGFLRLTDLAAMASGTGASHHQAIAFGALLFAALCAGTSLHAKWTPAALIGLIFAKIGVVATLSLTSDIAAPGTGVELAFLTGASAVTLLAAYSVAQRVPERAMLTGATVLALWAILSRFVYVAVGMALDLRSGSYALTFAWIAFAAALIATGFGRRTQLLRYWGFAVFGTTVGKVFLVDLAALDPAIRVAVLLVLGVTMIACGYWYIQNRRATLPPSDN